MELTQEQIEILEYMDDCTKLDPPDVEPVKSQPTDGWNLGDSDGDGE